MMVIQNKYNYGDTVYLKTDPDQHQRIVTGILVSSNNITYRVQFNTTETWHFDIELSVEKDVLKTTTN